MTQQEWQSLVPNVSRVAWAGCEHLPGLVLAVDGESVTVRWCDDQKERPPEPCVYLKRYDMPLLVLLGDEPPEPPRPPPRTEPPPEPSGAPVPAAPKKPVRSGGRKKKAKS